MPIVFAFAEPYLYTPIDHKAKSVGDWRALRRVRDIETNGRVSVVIDSYDEDWSRLAWVRLDGVAEVLTSGADRDRGARLVEDRYPQYANAPLRDAPIVRITVERASEWQA